MAPTDPLNGLDPALDAEPGALRRLVARLDDDPVAVAFARAAYRRLAESQLLGLDVDLAEERVRDAVAMLATPPDEPGTIELVDDPRRRTTLLRVHVVDGPFILSTLTEELSRLGLDARDLLHPAFGVDRDPDGRLQRLLPARDAARREAYLAFDLGTELDEPRRIHVRQRVEAVLADAQAVVRDFEAMKERVAALADRLEADPPAAVDPEETAEVVALLRWLLADHFILLGARDYDFYDGADGRMAKVREGSGLGLLAAEERSSWAGGRPLAALPADVVDRVTRPDLLIISRTNRVSTVHRQKRMMYLGVKDLDDDGRVVAEHRIVGLLAQRAFSTPASTVPLLRRKLQQILAAEDVVEHSHDERAIRTLFESMPKQDLFEASTEDLRRTISHLLETTRSGDVRVVFRTGPVSRYLSAVVTVPRDRFSSRLRERIQALLARESGAVAVDYHLTMSERDEPLMHFGLHLADDVGDPDLDVDALQREIQRLIRTFEDALVEALAGRMGFEEAQRVARHWCRILPATYTETTHVATAVTDIEELQQLEEPDALRVRLVKVPRQPRDRLRVRFYKAGEGMVLSDVMPVLESLGLVVIEEIPYHLTDTPVGHDVHLDDLGVTSSVGEVDVTADGDRIAEAASAMWHGHAETDSLNRLVIAAGLTWQQVAILRAYRRYRRQVGTAYSVAYTDAALVEHPEAARALVELFEARFDPDRASESAEAAARDRVLAALDAVERLDVDRILRSFLDLIEATVRTNAYRDRPWLALKFDSARVGDMPKPVPYREIFVYSPAMEGIHLRGGPVARGGVRWSDRVDDYRTEVLGLMKAQMTKNAVIVPTGSKGGFVLQRPPADPAALRAEVQAQYEVFVRALLDVTDDVRTTPDDPKGQTVPPPRVVRHDGDDPYLVVAADRGTATFSDVANAISAEYGYWLGDAFASGGSSGYDHKAMGITARGAWVAVQRHFRELGIDVQTEPITVAGVGDMSGDVFGNGMLRSQAIKLVAAFDHRDIFLDPDPDPARSFAERRRLAELPRSSWQDYDRAVISEGGGVWSRTVKRIPIAEPVQAALGITADELSPPELIQAILRAHVDLLFFGGIGTFVKAADETHAEVGDRANDAIRVDGGEVRARVIGEGGNLAVTQRGRIAYARRGGRCNTDAIDNAAGVNTSDREVNLKILLGQALAEGRLDQAERDERLAAVTDDVAAQVLRDNYLQTWAISAELAHSAGRMAAYEQLMADLEAAGKLDRQVEVLPGTAEMERRQDAGAGLTRPELAVLIAYAKVDLTELLLASDVPGQPWLDRVLRGYLPPRIAEEFGDLAPAHRLRDEIVATVMANDLCNRMGITWARRTAADLGVDVATVAAGYWIAREVADADGLWRAIEELDTRADPQLQLELKAEVDELVDAFARTAVRQGRGDIGTAVAEDRPAFVELAARVADLGGTAQRRERHSRAERWIDLGIPDALAERVAALRDLHLALVIAATSRESGRPVGYCGAVYALLADALPISPLRQALARHEPRSRWARWQHRGLVDDLHRLHHTVARHAIVDRQGQDPATTVEAHLGERRAAVTRARQLARQVQGIDDLDAIAVAVRALWDIA